MSKPAPAEPSMEDILASIRRIIADEEPAKPAMKTPPEPTPEPAAKPEPVAQAPAKTAPVLESQDSIDALMAADDPEPEVLDLKPDQMAEPVAQKPEPKAQPKPSLRDPAPDPFEDIGFAEPEPPRPVVAARPQPVIPPAPQPVAFAAPQPVAYAAPVAADGGLLGAETQNAVASAFGSLETAVFGSSGRTVEDLTKELLRPMLKTWLDDNLPTLVERLVREEIERVARGRR